MTTTSDNLNQAFHLTCDNNYVNGDSLFSDSKDYYSKFQEITDRLSVSNDTTIINNDDVDPDINTFNLLNNPVKYYLPDQFNAIIHTKSLKNKLSVLHITARSLYNKISLLEIFLASLTFSFDIVAVSEMWKTVKNENFLNLAG